MQALLVKQIGFDSFMGSGLFAYLYKSSWYEFIRQI